VLHSLGEYAALNATGVLLANDTIYLVGERARLLKHGNIEVAYINSLMETVLGGASAAIDVAKNVFDARGMEATKLNVPPRRAETRKAYLGLLLLSCEWELWVSAREKSASIFQYGTTKYLEYPAGFIFGPFSYTLNSSSVFFPPPKSSTLESSLDPPVRLPSLRPSGPLGNNELHVVFPYPLRFFPSS
jgi:hypothetical protein